ncbi:hypothetical protein DVH24_002125 [Malus domestica]|uniref:Uncharacterized protein n=1 Tax=Malus domestica TaxID=3750 RepID=A0A498I9E3_MALDO|nr:hypothetical protein DVH24_002125 [Malus domestica]
MTTLVGNRNQLHKLQCIGVGRVRFGSTHRYEFRVRFEKIHVGVLYFDDVASWNKFRKPRTHLDCWVFINQQVSLPFAVISLLLTLSDSESSYVMEDLKEKLLPPKVLKPALVVNLCKASYRSSTFGSQPFQGVDVMGLKNI